MKECMPYYYQVSDGHGSGAEYGFQAELFYERGEIIDADISNRMAMIKAELKKTNLALLYVQKFSLCEWPFLTELGMPLKIVA